MEKVVFVKTTFKELFVKKNVEVVSDEKDQQKLGVQTDVIKKEKKYVSKGRSDKEIDGVQLANDLQDEIFKLNSDGYFVTSISPITSGEYKYDSSSPFHNSRDAASYGWGYGFSYTEGMLIVARKL